MNVGKNILVGVHLVYYAKEIGKGNGKGFEKEKWHYLGFIYENNRKYEKRKVKGHRLHVRRKMKENNGN